MAIRRPKKKNGHVPPADEPRLPAPIPKQLGPGGPADAPPVEPEVQPHVPPPRRAARVERTTRETDVRVALDLDGTGRAEIDTPIPFFSHMLEALAKHSLVDLRVTARGDVEVDPHHTIEDVGICIGRALVEAIGDRRGMMRYGDATLPFDEALVRAAIDLGGRAAFVYQVAVVPGRIGSFDVELAEVFFRALAHEGRMNLHLKLEYGENRHHVVEGLVKTFARALERAITIDPRRTGLLASTKGLFD